MDEIFRRLARLEQKVNSLVRVGVVSSVDREKCRVRVAFSGDFVSGWLPVLVKQTGLAPDPGGNRDYWMPDVKEQVTCIFLPTGAEAGFVLGSFYSNQDSIPEGAEAPGMRVTEFDDGARFECDTKASKYSVTVGDLKIEITPDHVRLGGLEVDITTGHIRFGGESGNQPFLRGTDTRTLLEGLIDLIISHTHPTGVGPSGPPANAAAFTTKRGEVAALLSAIIFGR